MVTDFIPKQKRKKVFYQINAFNFLLSQIAHYAAAATNLTQVRTEYTRPGYGSRYGFTNWPMKKDFHKRECVRDHYITRMRLNAIRKNTILPKEIRVSLRQFKWDLFSLHKNCYLSIQILYIEVNHSFMGKNKKNLNPLYAC